MKFILNEELTLDEATGVSDSGKRWGLADDELYGKLLKNGYSQKEAEKTVNTIIKDEESGNSSDRKYWNQKLNIQGTKSTQNNTQQTDNPNQENKGENTDQQQNQNESPQNQNNNENSNDYEEADPVATTDLQLTNNEVADKLLKVIKHSNDRGFNNFLSGIKGNIKNQDFPFTRLMCDPEFSKALGIREGLKEGVWDNIKATVADSKLGKKFSTLKANISPKTFVNFATVYNAFINKDKDIRDSNYLKDNTGENRAIVFEPNLYKLKDPKKIKYAINVDISAAKAGLSNPELKQKHRARLKNELNNGDVTRVGELKPKDSIQYNQKEKDRMKSTIANLKGMSDQELDRIYTAIGKMKKGAK